jgi:hypothetical protein
MDPFLLGIAMEVGKACAPTVGMCANLPGVNELVGHMLRPPDAVRVVDQGVVCDTYNDASYTIPKVIWTYWDDSNLPEFVSVNLARWRRVIGQEYRVILITKDTLEQYIPRDALPPNLDQYGKPQQSDWIRFYVLHHHGGIWADTGILFNSKAALDALYADAIQKRVDMLGFYLDRMQTNARFPVIESWFFMVPALSPVMRLWFQEYDRAVRMGFAAYRIYATDMLGVDSQRIFEEHPTYLTCYLCLQTVIQVLAPQSRLYLQCAEDTMLRMQHIAAWNPVAIWVMVRHPAFFTALPLVKLRWSDRLSVDVQQIREGEHSRT